jgi:hypothetical protein
MSRVRLNVNSQFSQFVAVYATQNTFYKACIVFRYSKIKSGIQVEILLVRKVYLSLHFERKISSSFRTMTEPT